MKAVQQKSGRWQARYIDHYEYINGKKKPVLGCVTEDTEKKAINAATKLQNAGKATVKMCVGESIDKYIALKAPVLSPSTLKGYKALQKHAYTSISSLTLSEATGAALQAWVSEYSADHSPKAVRNAYALLSASVKMFERSADMTVTLPQPSPPKLYTPTDEDVKNLLTYISGTELEKAVILAALGTLRRGEVCALLFDDIVGNTVTVSKSMVELSGGGTAVKAPKTPQSIRTITLPPEAIKRLTHGLASGERVVKMTPTAISNAFPDALKACGLPSFRFQDLRAYAASVRHALGVPDQYIMASGGWKSDRVLKQIYRRTMSDKTDTFNEIVNAHFDNLLE